MMTLDQVRTALGSRNPAEALDSLVRGELAGGKTTGELYTTLVPMARTIRTDSPLPEDVDEILLGTLDALIGHCNPDECYHDPIRPDLPAEEAPERSVAPPTPEVPQWPVPK